MEDKGLSFNSSGHCKQWDIPLYQWLIEFGCFTFAEVKAVWEFIPQNEQEHIISIFREPTRKIVLEFFTHDQTVANKSVYAVLHEPCMKTRTIYKFLTDEKIELPKVKISKWEKDLNITIDEQWWIICN